MLTCWCGAVPVWLVVMMFVLPSSASPCPDGCRCKTQGVSPMTACMAANLTRIPSDIPVKTVELYLQGNKIRTIPEGAFSKLRDLRTLIMTLCGVEVIEPNAFVGLGNLGYLDLQRNAITELQPYTFSGLFGLNGLVLDSNNIDTIHNFAFHGLNLSRLSLEKNPNLRALSEKAFHGTRLTLLSIFNSSLSSQSIQALRELKDSLKELSLQENADPLVIPANLFQGFSFRTLKLDNNDITDTSFLRSVTTDDLSLRGNPTGPIDFSQYPNLRNLLTIRLDNTDFSRIEGRYFDGMTSLQQCYLSNNGIKTLPEGLYGAFHTLKRLNLVGNPFHCNCELLWFKRWLASTSAIVAGATCSDPIEEDLVFVASKLMTCTSPTLISISSDLDVKESNAFTLSCVAMGDPAPSITWELPDGSSVTTGSYDARRNDTVSQGVLSVRSTRMTDAGRYRCVADNVAGNVTEIAALRVSPNVANTWTRRMTWCVLIQYLVAPFVFMILMS